MLMYYFVPFIVSNRHLLFWVSNGHNSVTVQNRTHVYMNFFDHKDLGNLLQLCPKVVKHPVYLSNSSYHGDGRQHVPWKHRDILHGARSQKSVTWAAPTVNLKTYNAELVFSHKKKQRKKLGIRMCPCLDDRMQDKIERYRQFINPSNMLRRSNVWR